MLQKISENFLLKSAAYIVVISLSYKASYLIFKRVFTRMREARNMKRNNCMTVDDLYKFAKQQNKEFLIIKDALIQGISQPHNNLYLTHKNHDKKFMKLNIYTDHRIHPFPYIQTPCIRENVPYFQLICERSPQFLVVDLRQSNSFHSQSVRKIIQNRKYRITKMLEMIVGRASDCGVYFGSMIFLRGDFIYLKGSGILRCFKPKLFGLKSDMMDDAIYESMVLSIWGVLIGSIAIGVSLLYLTYLYMVKDETSILQQNVKWAQFQKNMACIECKKEQINIVLIPCYHFLYCELCSINKQHCYVCNREIEDRIKIYKG